MTPTIAYTRYELLRAFRNRRFLLFSLGFPVILFFLIVAPQRNAGTLPGTGVNYATYFMGSLASFGTMMAMISSGARIATERKIGWTRQLRVTPLSARAYLRAKGLTAYAMAIASLILLYLSGAILGAHLSGGDWAQMTGLILVGLLPIGALGIGLGHLVTPDTVGPLTGGLVSLLAIVSGTWFPVTHGFLHDIGQFLPSYWIAQAGRLAAHGSGWGTRGWLTVLAWAVLLGAFAAWAYRRDTGRM